jgi:hypothetical protein
MIVSAMAGVAHVLHFSLAELDVMSVRELLLWHAEAARIMGADKEG